MKKWIRAAAFMLSMLGLGSFAQADPVTWTLSNVVFSNDGPTDVTASGSFKYDADTNTFSDINISTTQGVFTDATVYTRACIDPACPVVSSQSELLLISSAFTGDMTGLQVMRIVLMAPMTNSGGALDIEDVYHLRCPLLCYFSGSGTRFADPGATIIGTSVAVPPAPTNTASIPTLNQWGLMLLAMALGGAAFWRQRRHS